MFTIMRACAVLSLCAGPLLATVADADDELVERGRYLVTIMDCTGCHTGGALIGQPDPARFLAGSGIGFGGPFGIVYPPNLTSDKETGLGNWTDEEILAAVREGRRPDGRVLIPVMPWPSYGVLTDDDAKAMIAYLRSLKPVSFAAPKPVGPGEKATAPFLSLAQPE